MLKIILSMLITILAVGCGAPRYVDYFPCRDDGTPKPKVALIPAVDISQSGLPWDVSAEISEALYYEFMNSGELYVLLPKEIGPAWSKYKATDFFDSQMSFCPDFACADFIVAMEVIEDSITDCDSCGGAPISPSNACNEIATMRMRLKVIDVRCETPRVILYEIVKAHYLMAPSRDTCGEEIVCWGSKGYALSPYGIVHRRMACNLARRLEEVLWSTR